MADLGPHAAFIWAAYASVFLVLGGLTAWTLLEASRHKRLLRELETKGVTRRSAKKRPERPAKGPVKGKA